MLKALLEILATNDGLLVVFTEKQPLYEWVHLVTEIQLHGHTPWEQNVLF